ncbi:unnamed protein product [Macrosiphum euphorbiae]|uniref:Peptidase aspartic putative domain-containing protein n=1 Tax=Macrosiphum euphorbiae TaxID=13131 RepID=A0AAV0X9Z6_9HEMI|nr:unnamed protein product [Macrosiphum euphorbiae]
MQQTNVLLWTTEMEIKDSNVKLQEFRTLLDNGSQYNFITQHCISALGLTTTHHTTKLSGVGSLSSYREAVITLQIVS